MKKRLLSALLCLCMVVCMMPTISLAANPTSGSCGDNVTWSLSDDGTLTISGTGEMENYSNTNYHGQGYAPWHTSRKYIETVVIESGVASIGNYAFVDCNYLESITIPDSIIKIGNGAFYACKSLSSVTIPNGITSMGDSAFAHCSSLNSITIPDSVTSIEDYAFWDCSSLTNVTIPNNVMSIGIYAFYGCSGLTSVTIGNSVTSIGGVAFYGCSGLTSVTIPNSVKSIGEDAFSGCSSLNSVTIGNSVTSIGHNAFYSCSSLTNVTIGNNVTGIGGAAFAYCSNLTSVTIPNGVINIESSAFQGCSSLTNVMIPNSVTTIGSSAFRGTGLTKIIIPASVVNIGSHAFGMTRAGYNVMGFIATVTQGSAAESYCKEYGVPYKYPSAVNFTDVDEGEYYATPVQWAVEHEITNGIDTGIFAPNMTCTRGQIVTFLWRANGRPEPASTSNPFTDVPENEYYYKAVLWAVEKGITTGTSDTTFSPNEGCTRGQVATFLWRAAGKPSSTVGNQFSDVDTSEYYGTAVLWASEKGITNGMGDGTFAPNATCTRGQIVTFLYRAMA